MESLLKFIGMVFVLLMAAVIVVPKDSHSASGYYSTRLPSNGSPHCSQAGVISKAIASPETTLGF